MVRRLNVDGDGQGDLAGHGGENRAVFVYQVESYRYWEEQLGRHGFTYGQFGENFTVEGLADDEVCIGDRYRIGDAVFEVTQPRVTCYRVGVRMDEPQMPSLLVSHRRPGFYLRVLQEGEVRAGDPITRLTTGPEAMTVAEMDGLLYLPRHPRRSLARALRIPALSDGWRESFQTLLDQRPGSGNQGLNPVAGARPAWTGFRPFRVAGIDRESASVISIHLVAVEQEAVSRSTTRPVRHGSAPARRRGRPSAAELLALGSSRRRRATGSASSGRRTVRPAAICTPGSGWATSSRSPLREVPSCSSRAIGPWSWPVRGSAPHRCWPCCTPWPKNRRHARSGGSTAPAAAPTTASRSKSTTFSPPLPDAHRLVCYSHPGPGDRAGVDYDEPGRLTAQVLDDAAVPTDGAFYLCGPSPFMHDLGAALAARGVTPDRIHTEVFGPSDASTPGIVGSTGQPPHPPAGPPGPGPRISFSRSNLTVPWDPDFQSLLELAEACDVPVRWSCRSGVCHTCETGLVSGTVSYRPEPVENPGPGNAYICCSHPADRTGPRPLTRSTRRGRRPPAPGSGARRGPMPALA